MAFQGYFIKKDGVPFPNRLVARKGYESVPNRRTDKNSYVDGMGELHRTILPKKRSTFVLRTVGDLSDADVTLIQSFFPNRDVVTLEYWNREENAYKTAKFYVPEITYVTDILDENDQPVYDPLEIEFIAYGGDIS